MNERHTQRGTEAERFEHWVVRVEALRNYGRFAASVDNVSVRLASVSLRRHSSGGTAVKTKLEFTVPFVQGLEADEYLITMKGFAVLRRSQQQAVDELRAQLHTFAQDLALAIGDTGANNPPLAITLRVDGEQTSGWSITDGPIHGCIIPAFGGFVAWLGRVERTRPSQVNSQDLYEYIAHK